MLNLRLFYILIAVFSSPLSLHASFMVGTGKADITGDIVGRKLIGYGNFAQISKGLHTRLYAKSFMIQQGSHQIVLSVCDLLFMTDNLREKVIQLIEKEQRQNGKLLGVNRSTLCLSATHTHSAPGGFSSYGLYGAGVGFDAAYRNYLASQIVRSILEACENLEEGNVLLGSSRVEGLSFNRAPKAFLSNPECQAAIDLSDFQADEETAASCDLSGEACFAKPLKEVDNLKTLPFDSTNKTMSLLYFLSKDGKPLGLVNYFALHPTSFSRDNTFISGDNKGIAAYLVEDTMKRDGHSNFIAAFANSDLGDVSSHNFHLEGLPHRPEKSFEAELFKAFHVGRRLASETITLLKKKTELTSLEGPLDANLQYIHMPSYSFQNKQDEEIQLSPGALGKSFAAGALDGPSDVPGCKRQMRKGSELSFAKEVKMKSLWEVLHTVVPNILKVKLPESDPKDLIFRTKEVSPQSIPFQVIKIGGLTLLGMPGEFSTMSGHRIREAFPNSIIVGLANGYLGYVTTAEEYSLQDYEGASTSFGPHSLEAIRSIFHGLSHGEITSSAPLTVPNFLSRIAVGFTKRIALPKDPKEDLHRLKREYNLGETLQISFETQYKKGDLTPIEPYFVLERFKGTPEDQVSDDVNWEKVADDSHPLTTLKWLSHKNGKSLITVNCFLRDDLYAHFTEGKYRVTLRLSERSKRTQALTLLPRQ